MEISQAVICPLCKREYGETGCAPAVYAQGYIGGNADTSTTMQIEKLYCARYMPPRIERS